MFTQLINQILSKWSNYKRQRFLQQAIDHAYASFAGQFPEWPATLFDHHFLTNSAASILTQTGQMDTLGQAPMLAEAWSQQLSWSDNSARQSLVAELIPVAVCFLQHLENELRGRQAVDPKHVLKRTFQLMT